VKTYEMQQTIQPGDQMWVNVASLIRDRVPDRKGNPLPADLAPTPLATFSLGGGQSPSLSQEIHSLL
jgi:hypothetical protein